MIFFTNKFLRESQFKTLIKKNNSFNLSMKSPERMVAGCATASSRSMAAGSWLISNDVFDLTSVSEAYIKMDVKSQFDGNGTLRLLWSTDYPGLGDPSGSTWTELSDLAAQLPAKGTTTYVAVNVDWSAAAGNSVYLAFQWEGGSNDNSASYEIDNIEITETT